MVLADICALEYELSIFFEHCVLPQYGDKSQEQGLRKHEFKSHHSE